MIRRPSLWALGLLLALCLAAPQSILAQEAPAPSAPTSKAQSMPVYKGKLSKKQRSKVAAKVSTYHSRSFVAQRNAKRVADDPQKLKATLEGFKRDRTKFIQWVRSSKVSAYDLTYAWLRAEHRLHGLRTADLKVKEAKTGVEQTLARQQEAQRHVDALEAIRTKRVATILRAAKEQRTR